MKTIHSKEVEEHGMWRSRTLIKSEGGTYVLRTQICNGHGIETNRKTLWGMTYKEALKAYKSFEV